MRQLLEALEAELTGRRLIRYMGGMEVRDVPSEQFFEQIRKMGRGLEDRNLRGRHIGIIGKNSYEWLVSLCAVFWAGAVAVLLDWESSSDTISDTAVDAAYAILHTNACKTTIWRHCLKRWCRPM